MVLSCPNSFNSFILLQVARKKRSSLHMRAFHGYECDYVFPIIYLVMISQ